MAESIPEDEKNNYETFRECLSEVVLKGLAAPTEKPKRRRTKKRENAATGSGNGGTGARKEETEQRGDDAEELGEFIDYLTSLIFPSLPPGLRTLTFSTLKSLPPSTQDAYSLPLSLSSVEDITSSLDPETQDSLTSYGLLATSAGEGPGADTQDLNILFSSLLSSYIDTCTTPPPPYSSTRTAECELCQRDWIPLTYHHLIPRGVHDKVRKRGWHPEERLNSVAWLCRACHSFVHRVASNEELARGYFTVESLMEREDVQGWVKWVGRVRWKSR